MPIVSTIVPCYKQSQFLDECLQSVLEQSFTDWECIIINDGSPDDTSVVAEKWVKKDSRFKYIYKENGGLSSSRNAGLKVAKGEWIQFLDCDDKIGKEKFQLAANLFHQYDIIISDYQMFDNQILIPPYCNYLQEELSYENIILNWDDRFTIPIHSAIFKKQYIQPFREDLKAKEDWLFWISFFKNNPSYIILNERLAYYRKHEKSMTQDNAFLHENEIQAYKIIFEEIEIIKLKLDFFLNRIQYKNRLLELYMKDHTRLLNENAALNNIKSVRIYNMFKKLITKIKTKAGLIILK